MVLLTRGSPIALPPLSLPDHLAMRYGIRFPRSRSLLATSVRTMKWALFNELLLFHRRHLVSRNFR